MTGAHPVDVRELGVRFGEVTAVTSVDLQADPGTAIALVGGNGAGKSSTLRVLAGVVPPTTGTVRVTGIDVREDPSGVRHATGYCPDAGGPIPRATPWEHFQLAARLRGMTGWEPRAQDLIERFDLGGAANRVTAGFSHGMGRRLSVALAAFHRPAVLLLDEPFDGVDPLGVDATVLEVQALLELGTAVVVSTHLLDLALRIADRAVVLRGGRVVAQESAAALAGPAGADHYRSLLSS